MAQLKNNEIDVLTAQRVILSFIHLGAGGIPVVILTAVT